MQSTRTKLVPFIINHPKSTISWLLCFTLISINIIILGQNKVALADAKKLIAITEIVEHPSLEQAKEGIIDVLQENGYKLGGNLEIVYKNAQGAIANALLIAKQFVSLSPDAIIAISTPSAQAVIKALGTTNIPFVFSSVTDPVTAGLVMKINIPEVNITGAIDYVLINEEIELIQKLLPYAKTIGFLYNAGEFNSIKTIELMKNVVKGKLEYIDAQVANSNQIGQAITALIGRVDVIYIPSDNTVFSAMPKLIQMSRKYKLPIFSSDPDSVKQGVLACIGYTQYEVGRTAGELLIRVLAGERNIAMQKPKIVQIFINQDSANIMGVEASEELLGIKTNIVVK